MHKHSAEFLTALFFVSTAFGADADIRCPATAAIHQVLADKEGWVPIEGSTVAYLQSVAFYSGNPREGASLVPDFSQKNRNLETTTWRFPAGSEPWLVCRYRETSAILGKKLRAGIRECEVHYRLAARGKRSALESISCR